MSASTYSSTIQSTLSSYKYLKEVLSEDEIPDALGHLGYILRPVKIDSDFDISASGMLNEHRWEILIGFQHGDNDKRTTNFDSFQTAMNSLKGIAGFGGFFDGPEFEDKDSQHAIGRAKFIMGIYGT